MKILESINLSELTSFSMGGIAKYLVLIENENDIKDFFEFVEKKNLNYFILGDGTNTIFNDRDYNGIIVKIITKKIKFLNSQSIEVSAGVKLSEFVSTCIENNLKGYEKMLGIPGTVGGAIRGNAGSCGQEIKDKLKSVKIYQEKRIKTYSLKECNFSYRDSIFKELKDIIILSARFKLDQGKREILLEDANKIIEDRKRKLPLNLPNAGSFFKNPIIQKINLSDKIPKNVIWDMNQEWVKISAAWLIENVGLKSFKINNVGISSKHSLFIVNHGDAKFSDLIALMNLIQDKVYKKFLIQLEPEVELVLNND